MILNRDFKEFISSLNASGVRYLVIGGYAVAFHGRPRYTKDLDVWIEVSEDNAQRIMQALKAFGFGALDVTVQDCLKPGQILQLGRPPHRIDLLSFADGVDFADCYATRVEADVDGVQMCFIDLERLKQNKRASGRPQDLADLDQLEE